jgi:hypothetical protein
MDLEKDWRNPADPMFWIAGLLTFGISIIVAMFDWVFDFI